jgi:type I restriction enzyme R subunit
VNKPIRPTNACTDPRLADEIRHSLVHGTAPGRVVLLRQHLARCEPCRFAVAPTLDAPFGCLMADDGRRVIESMDLLVREDRRKVRPGVLLHVAGCAACADEVSFARKAYASPHAREGVEAFLSKIRGTHWDPRERTTELVETAEGRRDKDDRRDALRMSTIGEAEKKTQRRVAKLFQDDLGYEHFGDLSEGDNHNILEGQLEHFLFAYQGYGEREDGEDLIRRAVAEVVKVASNTSLSLYDRNRAVYELLRYGVKVKADVAAQYETVWLIDWKSPERNRFAIAEEVTVKPADLKASGKRPDIVLYVNGIALGVLELKRSSVSVAEGIRQNLDNQKKEFIQPFFSTIQYVMAGNETEGLRYGAIQTPEKYYLTWKEDGPGDNPLDKALRQICEKKRFLELIHDFIVFDAGVKKLCRHNQYFGVRAAHDFVRRHEGGIVWHAQGSGKSLTMVWLAKWIRENAKDSRVLIITDRTELDEQIEKVFKGVGEEIKRTKSGADLIAKLNATEPWLLCSLIHKFGKKEGGEEVGDIKGFLDELKKALPKDFKAKGNLFVFVDECHRTQSGDLHDAMEEILPDAVFFGFTGTPLLKTDKKKSIEIFGRYIHTYKFDEAVKDGVVLDLRYEARDIDQNITSPAKIDLWFEAKTKGLTPLAKAQLKKRWGTMQKVLSCRERLEMIVADILLDMETRDRLKSGRGNAMLVAGSIYEACKFYELFTSAKSALAGKCAIVTSYAPRTADIKGEESGEGATDAVEKYAIYRQMLADWFGEPAETAVSKVEAFEKAVRKKFIEEPAQMKLLIVVDKLLTGFDAPPATYLYIDKEMRDHGLFQAICRVNRLDGEDKEFGYIVDYKDLFKSLKGAVADYTSGALDGYDKADVEGLIEDRLDKAKERLDEALEAVRALCEPVEAPRDDQAFYRYFSSQEHGNAAQLKANEPQRLALYKLTASLVRAYANVAGEMTEAGYTDAQAESIKEEVTFYEQLRSQVKLHSGDAIDLKLYEPAMRHLIDTYIHAEESETVSSFDDLSLVQLIVERGGEAVKALPPAIRKNKDASAETIENNVRRLIIDESPINPKYYEKMSGLLDALIAQRKQDAIDYQDYLRKIVELTREAKSGPAAGEYPKSLNTPAKRALFDNLGRDEALALKVDQAVRSSMQDGWRDNVMKTRRVRQAIAAELKGDDALIDKTLKLAKSQNDY